MALLALHLRDEEKEFTFAHLLASLFHSDGPPPPAVTTALLTIASKKFSCDVTIVFHSVPARSAGHVKAFLLTAASPPCSHERLLVFFWITDVSFFFSWD
jgi:hypothetical protein